MNDQFDLKRYHEAQARYYQPALEEIKEGLKRTHWMWFIFPQIKGLGRSSTAQYYAISCLDEARAYLNDEVLALRLLEISEALLQHSDKSAFSIFGGTDAMKLRSSMTLFDMVSPGDVFDKVLNVYFGGKRDGRTVEIIELPF